MAVTVRIEFQPPDDEDIVALRIYEGATVDGPFNQIERVTAIGQYPDYITHYTTVLATALTDYFTVAWEDSAGAVGDMSEAVKGTEFTILSEVMEVVALYDPNINAGVAGSVATAVIEKYANLDPNSVHAVTYSVKHGLALMTMASIYRFLSTANANSVAWSAGLVSVKQSNAAKKVDIDSLESVAAKWLGVGGSRVVQMVVPEIAQGFSQIVSADISRLLIEVV